MFEYKFDKMKIIKQSSLLVLLMFSIVTAKAQTALEKTIADWERAKTYTKEYLDAMPEGSFSLKPTPQMRSFADQFLHLADANYAFASAATDEKSPVAMGSLEKGTDKSKTTVIKDVLASYDFVIAGIKKMSAEKLSEKVKLFGKFEMTREDALNKCFEHQTHHRGQGTVYIRLAGATPPAEKLF